MKFLYFLADVVFRFRYKDAFTKNDQGNYVWDLDTWESQNEKMLRDFFLIGVTIGAIMGAIIIGVTWLTAR